MASGVLCMLLNVDKFFIAELQERGFQIDYKGFIEIYRASRQKPECIARQRRKEREAASMAAAEEYFYHLQQAEERKKQEQDEKKKERSAARKRAYRAKKKLEAEKEAP